MAVGLAAVAVFSVERFPELAQYIANGVRLSLYLAIFNMLPIPPLDGSKLLLAARIPMSIYREIARGGFMLLILAIGFSDIGRWMSQWSDAGARAIIGALR
jgi:Zn-dependent protease